MKVLIFFLLFTNTFILYAQNIKIESIEFEKPTNNSDSSYIPHAIALSETKNKIVEKINNSIKERFMIESFDPKKVQNFPWKGLNFESQIKRNILMITFWASYRFPDDVYDHLIFDLNNGNELKNRKLPFNAIFSLNGYFSFLEKYWLNGCKKEFIRATKCASFEPYCSYYDIEVIDKNDTTLDLMLTNHCFPHVVEACSPIYSIEISKNIFKQYLSSFGIYALMEAKYFRMEDIDRYLFYKDNFSKIPSYYFISGKIDHKYPFYMAFEAIHKSKSTNGYYYYLNNKCTISLTGQFNAKNILLNEFYNGKPNGYFDFQLGSSTDKDCFYVDNDKYWIGQWFNKDKVNYPIEFQTILMNK